MYIYTGQLPMFIHVQMLHVCEYLPSTWKVGQKGRQRDRRELEKDRVGRPIGGKDGITSHSLMFQSEVSLELFRRATGWAATTDPEQTSQTKMAGRAIPPPKKKNADSRIPTTFQDLLGNLTADVFAKSVVSVCLFTQMLFHYWWVPPSDFWVKS